MLLFCFVFFVCLFFLAYGLLCFTCETKLGGACIGMTTCDDSERCYSIQAAGVVTKGCQNKALCLVSGSCCDGNLCNNAITAAPSAIILLLSSAIATLFL
uniref:UPAR/Ly6 domain-containing protein n=1 Tax=Echeneis naucrates TaxID=173247 RepID=A0A665SX48_ECHNA